MSSRAEVVQASGGGLRHALTAAWGAITGVAPHVLHHVGPLAGAAVLAGAVGKLVFFALGLVVAIPMLVRLHRRFGSWIAPGLALAVFVIGYVVSSLYIGPALTGTTVGDLGELPTVTTTIHGHDDH